MVYLTDNQDITRERVTMMKQREADKFDDLHLPFGTRAGDNKIHAITCPTCKMPPTYVDMYAGDFYLFRNKLSAKEYYISGMCQHCQDSVFVAD